MAKTYTFEEFEKICQNKQSIGSDDMIECGGEVFKAGEIMSSIRALGYTNEQFNKLPFKKRAKVTRQSRALIMRARKNNAATESQIHESLRRVQHGQGNSAVPKDLKHALDTGHATWYDGKKKRTPEEKDKIFNHIRKTRPIREDDMLVKSGMACSALDLHYAMEVAAVTHPDIKSKNELIEYAFLAMRAQDKLKPKPADVPDNTFIMCGKGNYIKDCAFGVDMDVNDTLVLEVADKKLAEMRAFNGKSGWMHNDLHGAPDPVKWRGAKEEPGFSARYQEARNKIKNWILEVAKGNYKLEKPQGSSIHHLADYSVRHGNGSFARAIQKGSWMSDLQAFVVEHNWAAAFDNAKEFNSGEFRLPFPHCAFEFRISGMRALFLFYGNSDSGHIGCPSVIIGCSDVWLLMPFCFEVSPNSTIVLQPTNEHPNPDEMAMAESCFMPLYSLAFKQIRAVSIMLESEIATKQTVRAPEKLNRHREKLGRTALRDYHVVVLNRHKPRSERLPEELQTHGERNSPRLHFRSGHWRHFPNHRTWINWQLVGNPDLGFVDKHYRL